MSTKDNKYDEIDKLLYNYFNTDKYNIDPQEITDMIKSEPHKHFKPSKLSLLKIYIDTLIFNIRTREKH